MTKLLAYCLYGIIWILTLPPIEVLFIMEKPMAWILRSLLKYRKSIIDDNLRKSFPEKSGEDLLLYTKQYYQYLCRIFIESIKAVHWSVTKLGKRIELTNPKLLAEMASEHQNIIVLTGHAGNWEWSPAAICPHGFDILGIYKTQSNSVFDLLSILIRKKDGVIPTPMKGTLRAISKLESDNSTPRALLLIADQIPALGDIHFWQTFLNQDTAWFTGGEKIALKKNLPVFYLKTWQIAKGRYSAELIPLYDGYSKPEEFEITQFYVHALEQTIREFPSHWLWSHRRWKHQPQDVSL